MYTLYYSPFSCSLAVHIALLKTGAMFELEKIDVRKGAHQTEAYAKLNKRGKVPLLRDGDQMIDQGAGILLYLAEKHPDSALMPLTGDPLRPEAISTLFYMSNTVHPTLAMAFYPDRFSNGASDDVFSKAVEKTKCVLAEFEEYLVDKDYLNGSTPFAADYYLATMLNWLQVFNITLDGYPKLNVYKQRMAELPEVSRAVGAEMAEF